MLCSIVLFFQIGNHFYFSFIFLLADLLRHSTKIVLSKIPHHILNQMNNSPILQRCVLIASACHSFLHLTQVVLLSPVFHAKPILLRPKNRCAVSVTQIGTINTSRYKKINYYLHHIDPSPSPHPLHLPIHCCNNKQRSDGQQQCATQDVAADPRLHPRSPNDF